MADFKTHLTVASLCSSVSSTMLLASAMATPQEVLLYFILGVVGGLLPDIDSDNSLSVRLLFTFIATVISFLVMFKQQADNTLIELFLVWVGSFAFIKFFLFSLFTKATVHRGIIHSIPAAVLFGFIATILLCRIFHFNDFVAWMGGVFVFGGCICHLLLDELYSLNLAGSGPKKSLGTAFKFGSIGNFRTTAFIYLLIGILFIATPEHKQFFSVILDTGTYKHLKFFPKGQWFTELFSELEK
ncbi:MAG: metal-dependent hydrolase [Desulfobacteraceae bacterium]|nr:metal-dependent hydrolase [Desulfobacteraceae bacterium]